jgi:hypothetical protein
MIEINVNGDLNDQISALVKAYRELPKNIAQKHMKAAMGRAVRPFIPALRKNTPPEGLKKGRRKKGEKPRSSGALRRAVAVRTKARKLVVSGVLGYRAGAESRKAIWMEFGTSTGVKPRRMVERTMSEIRGKAVANLPKELAHALTKAVKDVAPPGTERYRGG